MGVVFGFFIFLHFWGLGLSFTIGGFRPNEHRGKTPLTKNQKPTPQRTCQQGDVLPDALPPGGVVEEAARQALPHGVPVGAAAAHLQLAHPHNLLQLLPDFSHALHP